MTSTGSGHDHRPAPATPTAAPYDGMDRLSAAFETSARRWELIVYPSLFAFVILAAYGFYLVFSLARDVHYLALSVDSNMTVLASNMQAVSDNMSQLTSNIRTMAVSVESINSKVSTLEPMLANIDSMDKAMRSMTYATHNIGTDMALNHHIARPMSFFNTFMPW